jgi:fumarylacetoacetase
MIDRTHDPRPTSWVASANTGGDFPIQNLPFGVFTPPAGGPPRGGVAIGAKILDLSAALKAGLFTGEARTAAEAAAGPALNPWMALTPRARTLLRQRLSDLLSGDNPARFQIEPLASRLLHDAEVCVMGVPAEVGDYTDFYAGIHHAENVGQLFRPDTPLLPNYKYVPIGYHGRASSIRPSGAPVHRPSGQRKPPELSVPEFGPSRSLDYELELGAWVGPGNALGKPVAIGDAGSHIVGFSLLNDWSARDLQAWEYQPLGPFLAKNFMTTVSPWVVTVDALAPFRVAQKARPAGDPRPLPYLWDDRDQAMGAFDIQLEVRLLTPRMRERSMPPEVIGRSNATDLYWTFAQLVAHHTAGGCNLRPGDLLGSGTISGPQEGSQGSLLERSQGGRKPIQLSSGEARAFLQDGDEISLSGSCGRGPGRIGFGRCSAVILG